VSSVAAWEVALAVVIMLASTYAVIRIAARVYAGAVLRAAPPPLLKFIIGATRAAIR
jgi:hypothetical protein